MAQYQNDELDYMEDEYGMADFDDDDDDDAGSENHNRRRVDLDSHYEDDSDVHRATDTTAIQARRGKDIQGIPWERLNFTRVKYRETRLQQYKNYENLPRPRNYLNKVGICHSDACWVFNAGFGFYLEWGADSVVRLWAWLYRSPVFTGV